MGITVALWNDKFEPIDVVIGFKHVTGEHSGINLAENFYDTIRLYNLHNQILAITTDNASSNGTFIDHVVYLTRDTYRPFKKDNWIRCFAHVINLRVKSALDVMSTLLQKLRDLIVGIRASPQRILKFKKIVNTRDFDSSKPKLDFEREEMFPFQGSVIPDDLLPILDCPTRWSSTYFFLKRALKLRHAIDEIAKDQDLRKNELHESEWPILREIYLFLEDFAVATTYVEGSKYPTLSLVVPMYNRLLNLLEEASRDNSKHHLLKMGAAAGFRKLSTYYDKASPVVMAATFMDPRCKMQYFKDNGWNSGGELDDAYIGTEEDLIATRVKPAIQRIWEEYDVGQSESDTSSSSNNVATPTTENSETTTTTSSIKSKINDDYIAKFILGTSRKPTDRPTRDELKEYELEDTEPPGCDPKTGLHYWFRNSSRWPKLSSMAKDLLSIPATSAASERAFRAAKDVFGIARMNLNPETVEALVCLRSWYRAGLAKEEEVNEFLDESGDISI